MGSRTCHVRLRLQEFTNTYRSSHANILALSARDKFGRHLLYDIDMFAGESDADFVRLWRIEVALVAFVGLISHLGRIYLFL